MSWLIVPFAVHLNGTNVFSFEERFRKRESLGEPTPKLVKDFKYIHFGSKAKQLLEKANLTCKFASGSPRSHSNKSRRTKCIFNFIPSKDNDNGRSGWPSGSYGHDDDARRKASPPTKPTLTEASSVRCVLPVAQPHSSTTPEPARTRVSSPWSPTARTKPS